jgi:type IV pilus assembly protein PilN
MAHINLLPWRETLRKKRQRDFGTATLLAVIVAGAACAGVHFYIAELISFQEQRNAYLEQEIRIVDKKIKEIKELEKVKAQLIARMNVIQALQSSRPAVVHLFDEMVATVPEGAHLTSLDQINDRLTFKGKAQSNARVSSYMRNIEASPWLKLPNLEVISTQAKDGTQLNEFTLQAKQIVKEGAIVK